MRRFLAVWVALSAACGPPAQRAAKPVGPVPPMSEASLKADVERLCDPLMKGRGSYQEGSLAASNFVAAELGKLGYRVVRQPVRGRFAENIVAIKQGSAQAVIVSAHHDHLGTRRGKVFPGADDNASGLAALLAIARSRSQVEFEKTVLFVSFGAEEDALVGSQVYVHSPVWPLEDTVGLVNFDMVGRNFFEAGANQPRTLAAVGGEGHPNGLRAAQREARSLGVNLLEIPARLLELVGLHDRTDDWWFRRQDIPAIHFSTGLHEDYHQVTDVVEKLEFPQVLRAARIGGAVLDAMAGRRPRGRQGSAGAR